MACNSFDGGYEFALCGLDYFCPDEMKCPFCPLIKLSPWYLQTDDGINVVRDLKDKGFKYRLLVVGSGKKWHCFKGKYLKAEVDRFLSLGEAVANRHIEKGWATRVAEIDTEHLSIPQHWHLQLCMI